LFSNQWWCRMFSDPYKRHIWPSSCQSVSFTQSQSHKFQFSRLVQLSKRNNFVNLHKQQYPTYSLSSPNPRFKTPDPSILKRQIINTSSPRSDHPQIISWSISVPSYSHHRCVHGVRSKRVGKAENMVSCNVSCGWCKRDFRPYTAIFDYWLFWARRPRWWLCGLDWIAWDR